MTTFILAAGLVLPSTLAQAPDPLTDRDRAVHSLCLTETPARLRELLRDPEALRVWGHDVLFQANPDTRDARLWDPSYRNWDPQTQTLTVSPLEKRRALEVFWQMEEANRRAEGRVVRRGAVAQRVKALVTPGTTHLFQAHWDNQDDTAFDGLIALDVSTGLVRVLMTNDFA